MASPSSELEVTTDRIEAVDCGRRGPRSQLSTASTARPSPTGPIRAAPLWGGGPHYLLPPAAMACARRDCFQAGARGELTKWAQRPSLSRNRCHRGPSDRALPLRNELLETRICRTNQNVPIAHWHLDSACPKPARCSCGSACEPLRLGCLHKSRAARPCGWGRDL